MKKMIFYVGLMGLTCLCADAQAQSLKDILKSSVVKDAVTSLTGGNSKRRLRRNRKEIAILLRQNRAEGGRIQLYVQQRQYLYLPFQRKDIERDLFVGRG